jgi:pimeloyl-ACP methyl ester carboxylesterase
MTVPEESEAMTPFVLVHGAFHGGWCWESVATSLTAVGHTVLTPDLPGAGDDGTPPGDVTLASATERVIQTLRSLEHPAVLVGHSMGGVVITQAAARAPELVSRLVYLTAFRPGHGEALLDLTGLPEGAGDGVQANISVTGNPPVATFDAAKAQHVFYNLVPADAAQRATDRLSPQPLALFATPVDIEGVQLPPQEYVICTEDRAIPPALQRLMAERSPTRVHKLPAGHSPFYSHTAEVVKILLSDIDNVTGTLGLPAVV